jgi:FkbM family methyltransferase
MIVHGPHMFQFKYKGHSLTVPRESYFIPYATFIAGEYDFLDITREDVVIDAGANIGDFTLKAALKARMVIAIEPNPSSLKLLKENTKCFSNVVIVAKALGNRKGNVRIAGNGVSSAINKSEGILVEMDTLSNIATELNVAPTILKMDIEGAERIALPGQTVLKTVRRAVVETHSDEDTQTCLRAFDEFGFKCRELNRLDIIRRTALNVLKMPRSFIAYEFTTDFCAARSALSFMRNRSTSIPSCDCAGMKLLEARKINTD